MHGPRARASVLVTILCGAGLASSARAAPRTQALEALETVLEGTAPDDSLAPGRVRELAAKANEGAPTEARALAFLMAARERLSADPRARLARSAVALAIAEAILRTGEDDAYAELLLAHGPRADVVHVDSSAAAAFLEEAASLDPTPAREVEAEALVLMARVERPIAPRERVEALLERVAHECPRSRMAPEAAWLLVLSLAEAGEEARAQALLPALLGTSHAREAEAMARELSQETLCWKSAAPPVLERRNLASLCVTARPVAFEAALDAAIERLRDPESGAGLDQLHEGDDLLLLGLREDMLGPAAVVASRTCEASPHPSSEEASVPDAAGTPFLLEASGPHAAARTIAFSGKSLALRLVALPDGVLAACVVDPRTGAPVPAAVTLIESSLESRKGKAVRFTTTSAAPTDAHGVALLSRDTRYPWACAIARVDDGRIALALDPAVAAPPAIHDAVPQVAVAWERSLVLPGEIARARLWARLPDGLTPRRIEVELRSEAIIATASLALDGYGGATLEVPLPRDLAGVVRLSARVEGLAARVLGFPLVVAHPSEPSLEVTLSVPARAAPGERLAVPVHVRDSLGFPVVGAATSLRTFLTRDSYASGVATDASGDAVYQIDVRGEGGETLVLAAVARDAEGRGGSTSAVLPVARGAHRVLVTAEKRFATAGETVPVEVAVLDAFGDTTPSSGKLVVRHEDGTQDPETRLALPDGRIGASLKLGQPGVYDVSFVESGSGLSGALTLYALSPDGSLPAPRADVEVVPERPRYAPGETARFLVRAREAGAWVFLHASTRMMGEDDRLPRAMALPGRAAIVSVPPGSGTRLELEAIPLGTGSPALAGVDVGQWESLFSVSVTPDKDAYKPKDRAQVRVHCAGPDGLPLRDVQVAVSFEEAALARAAEVALPAARSPFGRLSIQEGERGETRPLDRRRWLLDGTFGAAPWASPFDLHAEALLPCRQGEVLLPEPTREDHLPPQGFTLGTTNGGGDLQVAFTVPDAGGRFLVRARAVSRDGRTGEGEGTILGRAPVRLELVAPPVLEQGDESVVVARVTNDGAKALALDLSLKNKSPLVVALEPARKGMPAGKLAVPAHGEQILVIPVRGVGAGVARIDAHLTGQGVDLLAGTNVAVRGLPLEIASPSSLSTMILDVAPQSSGGLTLPAAKRVLVRVETPAALLGDVIEDLSRERALAAPEHAFAAALAARAALDARHEPWDAVAKRALVDPGEVLPPGTVTKLVRDPRRSPLFSQARLDALARAGLDALARRRVPGGWSLRERPPSGSAIGAPDLEATAQALEEIARASGLGSTPAHDLEAAAVQDLSVLLRVAAAHPPEARAREAAARAHAALALARAGEAVPLEGILADRASLGLLGELRLALARCLVKPGVVPEAPALLAREPGSAVEAALALELALAMDPGASNVSALAMRLLALAGGPLAAEDEEEVAFALSDLVTRVPPELPQGSVVLLAGKKTLAELKLPGDDQLLTDAALLVDVGTLGKARLLSLARKGKGAVTVQALALEPLATGTFACSAQANQVAGGVFLDGGLALLRPASTAAPAFPEVAWPGERILVRRGVRIELDLAFVADGGPHGVIVEQALPHLGDLDHADASLGGTALVLPGRVRFSWDHLPAGVQHVVLVLRATLPGTYLLQPAVSLTPEGALVRGRPTRIVVLPD